MDDKRIRLGASNPAMLPKAGQRDSDDNDHTAVTGSAISLLLRRASRFLYHKGQPEGKLAWAKARTSNVVRTDLACQQW
jgi:hypothetical protein